MSLYDEKLSDLAAERAVLAGLFHFGQSVYLDIANFVQKDTFVDKSNQALFHCLHNLFTEKNVDKADNASMVSVAYELGYAWLFEKQDEARHVKSIFNTIIKEENVATWAAKIRKLQIARLLKEQLSQANLALDDVKGTEPITKIFGIAESAIFDFTSLLRNDITDTPKLISDGILDFIQNIENNPDKSVGIASGFPYYDQAIGGGFRRKTISLVGARSKVGKSFLALSFAHNITTKLKIPVLYLDTEMKTEDHWARIIPNIVSKSKDGVKITINELESGKYTYSEIKKRKVREAALSLNDIPLYYLNISGRPFEEILGIMRKWINRVVGYNANGTTKDCVILYDYLKLMSSNEISDGLREYQILGFMTTSLHNFAVSNDVPIVALIQLNRDGIDEESTSAISQSDRILWLVTNFTIYKMKSDIEIADIGLEHGTRKLVPIAARHGEGLQPNDYINVIFNGKYGIVEEGELRSNIIKNRNVPPSQ